MGKRLGQHFLKAKRSISKLIDGGDVQKTDIVVEIGPGKGVLTEILLEKSKKVIAIEKDSSLIPFLSEKFEKEIKEKRLEIIEGDILDFNPEDLPKKYKIVANIPYYITGAIIKLFLESKNQPEKMVLMMQKEVAERIVCRDGKQSILSLSVSLYGAPKYLGKVPARDFSPPPQVDSAIISIEEISKKNVKNIDEKHYFDFLKKLFNSRRKTLMKQLSLVSEKDKIKDILNELNIKENERAENLTQKEILLIYKKIFAL